MAVGPRFLAVSSPSPHDFLQFSGFENSFLHTAGVSTLRRPYPTIFITIVQRCRLWSRRCASLAEQPGLPNRGIICLGMMVIPGTEHCYRLRGPKLFARHRNTPAISCQGPKQRFAAALKADSGAVGVCCSGPCIDRSLRQATCHRTRDAFDCLTTTKSVPRLPITLLAGKQSMD